jgi:hypothetical protein
MEVEIAKSEIEIEDNKMEDENLLTTEKNEENIPKEKMIEFLNGVGLSNPLDYIFLSYATTKSVKAIEAMNPANLLFLFHLLTNDMIEKNMLFPRAAFIEKLIKEDKKINVVWTFSPSENFETREKKSFENFHLYFMNILKPSYQYSPEELYKIFREKKEEMYFLNHGSRNDSETRLFHVLFVCPKMIIAFHIPFLHFDDIPKKELFMSKWISNDSPVIIQDVFEYDIFEFPSQEYFSHEETKEQNLEVIE